MNRLNKTQVEYAAKRISTAAYKKKEVLKKKLTTGEHLTAERRATLLRLGKVKLSKGVTRITGYTDVVDVFDFSKFEQVLNSKKYDKECLKIDKESSDLMDELMLGDTQRALDIISNL